MIIFGICFLIGILIAAYLIWDEGDDVCVHHIFAAVIFAALLVPLSIIALGAYLFERLDSFSFEGSIKSERIKKFMSTVLIRRHR